MADEGKQAESKPDDTVPSAERQAELEVAYQENVAERKPPYAGTAIQTRGELDWVMDQRNWTGGQLLHKSQYGIVVAGPDLSYADLSGARLRDVNLSCVNLQFADLSSTNLYAADLSGADLSYANLSSANLGEANLSNADLSEAILSGADLTLATMSEAVLWSADLSGACLQSVNLSGANLALAAISGADLGDCLFDETANLADATFDTTTLVADVNWNGVSLTRIAWKSIPTLGDEAKAQKSQGYDNKPKSVEAWLQDYTAAARAYRQLSVVLRSQGMNDDADNYAYRAQLMQRVAFRWSKQWDGYLLSWFLFLISGYGYRLWRILAAYGAVVVAFTFLYWLLGVHSHPHESGIQALWDSLLVSLSAIHGRTTFEQLGAWSPAAWVAAVESVCGIVIEGVFVAMLIQRFFAR